MIHNLRVSSLGFKGKLPKNKGKLSKNKGKLPKLLFEKGHF